jgi:hypothetical protein
MDAAGRRSQRRLALIVAGITPLVVVALILPTFATDWGPLIHYSCQSSAPIGNETVQVPLSLLNTPYLGSGYVNSSIPGGLFGSTSNENPPSVVGGWETNGSIWGAFWKVNVTLYSDTTQIVAGPGSDTPCNGPYSLGLRSTTPTVGYQGAIFDWPGAPMFGPNSTSDRAEPGRLIFYIGVGGSSSNFLNGFTQPNDAEVSTCDSTSASRYTESSHVTTSFAFQTSANNLSVSVVFPFVESFHYVFPADTGVWQIDNLSAPNGPGGGWAFSYAPCA